MKAKFIPIVVIALVLSACNLPAGTSQEEEEGAIFTQAAETVTAAAVSSQITQTALAVVPTVSLTDTPIAAAPLPAATASNVPPPCNAASFVQDVTIPDDTEITVNQAFVKTWRLRNDGTCTWTSGYQLIFDSGDQMGGAASQPLTGGTVAPGQSLDVSVNLVAPNSPGTYKGNWKIREPGGAIFGIPGSFWVQIKAVSAGGASWPIYKNGDSGEEVYAIQYLLTARGYNTNADGLFGPVTKSKVQAFQSDKGLAVDGIVGPQTWQALIIQVSSGTNGPAVRAVQTLLRDKFGYNTVNVDGIFGPKTKAAVEAYQTSRGLSVDGIVGPQTWKAMISE